MLAIPYNSMVAQKISDIWIPALSEGDKCYQAKNLTKKLVEKPNLINYFDFEYNWEHFFLFCLRTEKAGIQTSEILYAPILLEGITREETEYWFDTIL